MLWIQIINLFQTIRWCARKRTHFTFTGLPQSPVHSEASLLGCQYRRSSTITYNLTSTDIFTQFLCESGDDGMCGTGSAIQYVNISLGKSYIITSCEAFSLYLDNLTHLGWHLNVFHILTSISIAVQVSRQNHRVWALTDVVFWSLSCFVLRLYFNLIEMLEF